MITRLLKPEESWRWDEVMAVAFEYGFDREKAKAEAEKERTEEEKEAQKKDRCFGSFSDDEKVLYGCVNSHEYTCRFDGGEYLLGGVGGVSTLPPYRRKGAIRACITESLKDMYARNFTFSYLFPFSTQYYRKFGYEVAASANEWTLNLKDIRPVDVGGSMEQLFPGDDLSPLLEVYNKCFADVNLSALRDTYSEELDKKNFMLDMRYVYVWRNDAGEPRGLMISKKTEDGGKTLLNCTHTFACKCGFLFCDAEALNALLFFAKSAFSSDYDAIRFTALPQASLTSLVGENNEAACRPFWNGMLRVVNVQRVLENCNCCGEDSVRIEITDGIIPENCGVWKLTFAPGKPNLVEKTEEAADVSLTINLFSALICGARPAADIPWMPDAKLHNEAAPLESVFYLKKCYMMDLF